MSQAPGSVSSQSASEASSSVVTSNSQPSLVSSSTLASSSSGLISESHTTSSSQSPPSFSASSTASSSTSSAPSTCPTYSASCSDVMNGILASNSIASPELVDYRIQSAQQGITSPSDFLAALGTDPCQMFTDPTEYSSCVDLLANSQFVEQLTDMTNDVLGAFQTCASGFAAGEADYQIIINDPNNATCAGPQPVRRHEKRMPGVGEVYDLTWGMLEDIEDFRSTAVAPLLGRMKSSSSDLRLMRKQLSTCAQTGTCFETCPDCRDQQTYCGGQATIITTAVCGGVAAVVNAGVAVVSAGACGSVCGPAAPLCAAFCARAAGGLSAVAVGTTCAVVRAAICDPLTQRCANCNSANNGVCDPSSTQCCAGETGTQCGTNCCCCPQCQAPGGINCACTAAPC